MRSMLFEVLGGPALVGPGVIVFGDHGGPEDGHLVSAGLDRQHGLDNIGRVMQACRQGLGNIGRVCMQDMQQGLANIDRDIMQGCRQGLANIGRVCMQDMQQGLANIGPVCMQGCRQGLSNI